MAAVLYISYTNQYIVSILLNLLKIQIMYIYILYINNSTHIFVNHKFAHIGDRNLFC